MKESAHDQPWRHIDIEVRGNHYCAQLRNTRIEESDIEALAHELVAAASQEGCTTLVFALGPKPPECLYSVFLGKLISVQRRIHERGRRFVLSAAAPEVLAIFAACKLADHFTFVTDSDALV